MEPAPLELKKHSKYFFIGSFLLIIVISAIIARPFISAVFGAIVLAYLFHPVYEFIFKRIKNETICAFIVSILVLIVFFIPILFVGNALFKEASNLFFAVRDFKIEDLSKNYIGYLNDFFGQNIDFSGLLNEALNRISIVLLQSVDNFIFDLPQKIISAFVMVFVMFYLFKDGKRLLFSVKEALPLKRKYKDDIAQKFNDTIYATMYGVVVTAIIQGIIGAIGFWIFDVSSPILWGGIMIILAMIPFVGAAFVWLPAALFKLGSGEATNGFGLLLYGLFVVSTIDNIVRPKIIGRRSKVHPALILIGALGGIKLFGLIGIIIGPLVLSILTVFFDIYLSEEYENA
mgnify:CR=1 FL=1